MTRQIKDKLSFRRRKRTLEGYPLETLLDQRGIRFDHWITSCWRGYIARWTLSQGKLYLTGLSGNMKGEHEGTRTEHLVDMDILFPGKQQVFAEWYSGVLCWHVGPLIYQDLLLELYLHDYFVKIESGKIVATKVLNKAYLFFADNDVEEKLFAGELDMSPSAMARREENFRHLQRKESRYLFDFE